METLAIPVCKKASSGQQFHTPCKSLSSTPSRYFKRNHGAVVIFSLFSSVSCQKDYCRVHYCPRISSWLTNLIDSFLLRLGLVLRNHSYNRMFTSADISLSSALKSTLHFAIAVQARKLHGEIDHIFVCVLKPDSLPPAFSIMTGIHVDEDKAVSWDVVENPVLPACKPPIPCLKKVKIEQHILGSMDEELICAICLQDFPDGTEAAATKCSHLFHCHCIVKWLSKSTSCPMCRSKLPVG